MTLSRSNILFLLFLLAIIGIVAFVVFGGAIFNGNQGANSDLGTIQSGESLPYTDLDGNPVDIAGTYGENVLVINSWASWCPFCVNELPDFNELGSEFKDRGVTVIAINRAESQNTANAFVDHVGNPENMVFLLDEGDVFYDLVGGFSMPETIFYDREGNVSFHKRGFMPLEEMRMHVENALAATAQ